MEAQSQEPEILTWGKIESQIMPHKTDLFKRESDTATPPLLKRSNLTYPSCSPEATTFLQVAPLPSPIPQPSPALRAFNRLLPWTWPPSSHYPQSIRKHSWKPQPGQKFSCPTFSQEPIHSSYSTSLTACMMDELTLCTKKANKSMACQVKVVRKNSLSFPPWTNLLWFKLTSNRASTN